MLRDPTAPRCPNIAPTTPIEHPDNARECSRALNTTMHTRTRPETATHTSLTTLAGACCRLPLARAVATVSPGEVREPINNDRLYAIDYHM